MAGRYGTSRGGTAPVSRAVLHQLARQVPAAAAVGVERRKPLGPLGPRGAALAFVRAPPSPQVPAVLLAH